MLPYVFELKPVDCFSAFLNFNDSPVNSSVDIVKNLGYGGDDICKDNTTNIYTNNLTTCGSMKTDTKNAILLSDVSKKDKNFFENNCFVNNFCKRVLNVKLHSSDYKNKQVKACNTPFSNFSLNNKRLDLCCQYIISCLPNNEEKKEVFLNESNLNKKIFMKNKRQNDFYFFKTNNTTRKRYLQRRLAQVFCILGVIFSTCFIFLLFAFCVVMFSLFSI